MSKMKRNDSLLNIESILSSPSPEHNENFNISTNSNFGSSHATSPPKLVFHRARHSADYDHFMSPPLTSSLPPPTPLDPYSSNYHTDSLPNYYEIAIKQHQLIAQQQEFARLYVNPNSSTTNSKTNLSLASIFIPPSLYESESSSEATYECQKEKSALQGREEEEIGIFSPISQNSSGYSVDLTGLTSSPGIPLIGDSFEVPSSPNGDPLMPTMDSPATSSVELTRKFSHKEYTSTSLEQDEDPSTPTSRSRSAPPKRRRVKPGSNPNLQASLDSPSMSTEISDSQGSSQAKISGDKEEEDDEYEDCEEHEETVPEIQINNHHLPINESDPFFNIPLRDIMHSSMISTHHLSHDADEEFQILSETQNLDLSSNENIDQGFSEESKTELDHTTDVSSILESPMTPALKSAPPVFNNQRTSLSFDDCLPIESELPVISEDVNEEDARKHAQSISECETIRQKSLEQDFPSEPEESPPEDEPVILKKEDHLGLPEEYLSVPEESNQESSSQEEEDLFPMDKLSLEERGLIAHPRSASDHILSSRMQRKSVEFEETIELHKEPELEPSVEFRKKAPSSPHRVDRCKSHIILGTTPSLNLPKEPSIDVDDILSTSSPMDRKLSTSTPSIADIEGNQFTLPSYSKEIQTPVLTRKKVIREKDLERPKTIGSSLSAQPSMKKKEKDEKKSNTAPATMDPKMLDRGAKPKVKSWLEWSIRLNKKKNKDTRSLSNFMNSPLPDKKVSVTSMERKISSIENYDKVQGLPDDLKILNDTVRSSRSSDRSPLTPSTFQEDEFAFENGFKIPEFEKPKWIDLQLWKEEDPAWTATHSNLKLTSNEKKRQNIIHEFYYTEKQHCQMIVFLQQAYHYGLKNNRILHDDEIAGLIPDVLDSLLVFHLQLLRKIRRRQHENFTVEKISDIVCEEFENGPQTTSAINAYTLFCSHREEAIRRFNHYSGKYSKFKEYMEFCDGLKEGKNKTFKEKLLQIASRLTKYPVLMEQIAKYDLSEHKEESKRAQHAVKQFALKVDRELTKIELNKRWDQLRQKLEMTSVGRLLKEPFTVSDLVNQDPNDCRKVVSLGAVKMQDVKTGVKVELAMVLFDDIIVLFQEKNGILQFFKSNEHASVIPLQTLIPREMERTNEIMLVVTAKECPDMYRLIFGNKSDVRNWIQAIKSARENAPKYVRRSYGTQKVESANQMGSENDPEEIAYNEKISAWQKELDAIFAKRQEDEELLRTYMNTRMKFFDDVRAHFKKFPVKPVKDPHLIPGSSKAKIEKIKESKDLEKMRKIVNLKFAELKNFRRSALDSLVEAAQKARDSDLTSYFDDLFDLSHPDQTTTSSSEENEVDGGSQRQKKPRRVRTFAGETSSLQQNAIRRHTTLPKMDPNAIEEEKEYEMLHEAEMKQLPLKMSGKSRRAASKIIEENIDLRLENARLKNEVARQELLLISMKSKKQPLDSAEKLEQLRMRQEEIRAEEKKVKLEKELLEKEYELKMAEIAEKEAALMAREESLSLRRENSPSHTLYMRNGERPNSSPTIPVHLATQTILTDKKKLNKNNKK